MSTKGKKRDRERENRGRSDCHVEGGITAEKGMREVKRGGGGGEELVTHHKL